MPKSKIVDTTFNPSGSEAVANIKAGAEAFEAIIEQNANPGRRKSVALTNLETSAMYAVKSVFEP